MTISLHPLPLVAQLNPRSMYIPPEIRSQLEEIERRSGYLWKFLDVTGKQTKIADSRQV